MAIGPGSRVGPYEVTELLGEGGMGTVWRAHHPALKRDVALKVLPDAFASDPERLARFQREAQILASLNQPNIAHVYGLEDVDGSKTLVMELVEGPTLADRIANGPIPVDEALPIAKQIAEALEAAHEQGIIHRDLKPANIKVRSDGTVKVLDFGLAKALEPMSVLSPGRSLSPTITTPAMTRAGAILGTAAYMSPEQARAMLADRRADIWAFGCVLYEMLTGYRAFDGEEVTDTLAAVLRDEVDWTKLPRLHPRLAEVLKRCFQKDPRRRLRDIGDFRIELDEVLDNPAGAALQNFTVASRRPPTVLVYGLVAAAGALLAIAGAWYLGAAETQPITRFLVDLPANQNWTSNDGVGVSISPDGRFVAYTATNAQGIRQLFLRPLTAYNSAPISASEGAYHPFFSPDSRHLGFFVSGSLRRVAIDGGNPIEITSRIDASARGATWAGDGNVYFGGASGVSRVAASGGVPERVTSVDKHGGAVAHRWPEAIPGHQGLLFTVFSGDLESSRIAFLSLQSNEWKVLLDETGHHARYAPTGHVVYLRGSTMMAVPFDIDRHEITGTPAPVLDGVASNSGGASHFRFSENGTLAYIPGQSSSSVMRAFLSSPVWVDAKGNEEPIGAPLGRYLDPVIAPDATRVAMTVVEEDGTRDIWIWDVGRRTWTVLTRGSSDNEAPVWTSDGHSIVYSSDRNGPDQDLYMQSADGIGEARRLTRDDRTATVGDAGRYPASVSSDGRSLFFVEVGTTNAVGALRLDREGPLERLFEGLDPRPSPDGRWLAYSSDESGSRQNLRSSIPGRRIEEMDRIARRRRRSPLVSGWPGAVLQGRERNDARACGFSRCLQFREPRDPVRYEHIFERP